MKRRNPWIGILWAITAVLIVGMVGADIWQASFYYPRGGTPLPGPIVSFFQELANVFVLPGMLVGFATLAGLLFFHARRRAHRVAARSSVAPPR